jgi:hypothetical protein
VTLPRSRRAVPTRAAALVLLAALAAMVAAPGGSARAAARMQAEPATAQVLLTRIQPVAPGPTDTLDVAGQVSNAGPQPLANLSVQLRIDTTPVGSRAELTTLARGTGQPPGETVQDFQRPAAPLAPGSSVAFDLSTPLSTVGLTGTGVYPLTVEVIADDPTTGDRTRVGQVRTFLPWGMRAAKPTRVALLWPVVATPARTADGVPVDHQLHDEIAGRLSDLLDAVGNAPATWVVDGDTLEGARSLAGGAPTAPGTSPGHAEPDATAADWLQRFEDATATGDVRALPYADPDLTAVVRAGLASDVRVGTVLGRTSTDDVLKGHATVSGSLAWPADGSADRATLAALPGAGLDQVLLSSGFAPPVVQRPWTSSALGPLAGTPLTAVVVDGTLTTQLVTPADQQGGPVLARQRMLAETAMVAAELPSVSRSVVLAPPRSWRPDVAYVRLLLGTLRTLPWVHMVTLGDLATDAPEGPARQRPAYPQALRARELGQSQLADVRRGHVRLDALAGVLAQPVDLQDAYGRALLRSESVAWRDSRVEGAAYARTVVDQLGRLQDSVRIVPTGAVTLAARSGRIPITVTNGLTQAVTVRVSVVAVPAVRLTVTQPGTVTVPPHGSMTLDVQAEATTNGSVQLVARLVQPDGAAYGPKVVVDVRITGLGAVAAVIVVVSLALLAGALVVRVVGAVRRGRPPGSGAARRELVR